MTTKIAAAFVKAKKEFAPALKNSVNPHLKNRYADLSACLEAVDDALLNNGIALIQQTRECETGVSVETIFLHESGEQLSAGIFNVPAAKQDPQGYGSALTYCRRYSLMAACGIAAEDDDGNAASRKPKPASDDTAMSLEKSIASIHAARNPTELHSRLKNMKGWVDSNPQYKEQVRAVAEAKKSSFQQQEAPA